MESANPQDVLEARLRHKLRRHGWRLERRTTDIDGKENAYRIVEAEDGSPVVGENFTLDLQDVAIWLE